MSEGRSKRRCVLRKHTVPSAAHYVGYVEDAETPEMIMRKFEEMERILAKQRDSPAAPGGSQSTASQSHVHDQRGQLQQQQQQQLTDEPLACRPDLPLPQGEQQERQQQDELHGLEHGRLDNSERLVAAGLRQGDEEAPLGEEQLHEIFKATSIFNVRAVLSGNEALMARNDRGRLGCGGAGASTGGFWGDGGGGWGGSSGGEAERWGWSDGEPCSDDDDLMEELRGFWSDEEWGSIGGAAAGKKRRPKHRRGAVSSGSGGNDSIDPTAGAGNGACGGALADGKPQRRPKGATASASGLAGPGIPPLSAAWGRPVRPYGAPLHWARQQAPRQRLDQQQLFQQLQQQLELQQQQRRQQQQQRQEAMGQGKAGRAAAATDPEGGDAGVPAPAYHCAPDICRFDFSELQQREYFAVLINTGWMRERGELPPGAGPPAGNQPLRQLPASGAPAASASTTGGTTGVRMARHPAADGGSTALSAKERRMLIAQRLAAVPVPQLCPRGFVFVWAKKQHIPAVVSQLYEWGYVYIENLTWVWKHQNNTVLRLPHTHAACSHITLLMFRKEGEGRDIQLRHQRSPDVVFDCIVPAPGVEWRVPQEVYATLETMLPTCSGSFLELWAAASPDHARPGWTHIAEAAAGGHDVARYGLLRSKQRQLPV